MAPPPDIHDLLESPNESEGQEYKSWINLTDKRVQRDIAKHIAALANYGGGYLIFGFNDLDLSPDLNVPADLEKTYNRDYVNNAIVLPFLEPAIHCEVTTLTRRASGTKHVVVQVPSHGATPICHRRGGESFDGSTTENLAPDTYYVRKPGPKSDPIVKAIEWKPIFQRCVLHEADHLQAAIKTLVVALQATQQNATLPIRDDTEQIAELSASTEAAFLQVISGTSKK